MTPVHPTRTPKLRTLSSRKLGRIDTERALRLMVTRGLRPSDHDALGHDALDALSARLLTSAEVFLFITQEATPVAALGVERLSSDAAFVWGLARPDVHASPDLATALRSVLAGVATDYPALWALRSRRDAPTDLPRLPPLGDLPKDQVWVGPVPEAFGVPIWSATSSEEANPWPLT